MATIDNLKGNEDTDDDDDDDDEDDDDDYDDDAKHKIQKPHCNIQYLHPGTDILGVCTQHLMRLSATMRRQKKPKPGTKT